jgi:hypothetical protein
VLAVPEPGEAESNQRNIGVAVPLGSVTVHTKHPRNHSGSHFSVLLSRTWDRPTPGSDEIDRAFEDAWIGRHGYRLSESSDYQPSLAFLGNVVTLRGERITELFVLGLPADVSVAGEEGPLEGTLRSRPRPPRGTLQRRLTFTADFPCPGISEPRHWPRSTPDGEMIFFLMRDAMQTVQLWSISPRGGCPRQLTHLDGTGVTSAFTVSFDGQWIAHTANHCLCVTSIATGHTRKLTEPRAPEYAPRPEACVFAPNDLRIAYIRRLSVGDQLFNQVCVATP